MKFVKSFTPQFKSVEDDGTASWVMATLNSIDSDGDVTLPGALGEQTFSIQPAHDHSHVPLGKARLYEEGAEAIVEAKFNLDIPAARDWHSAIKFDLANPPAVQEYSYGYEPKEGGTKSGTFMGRQVRFFQPKADGSPGIDVYETSPVLRGAGVGTRTLSAKAAAGTLKFSEHIESVVADVEALIARAADGKALRSEKGKTISDTSAEVLARLSASLKQLDEMLAAPPADTSSEDGQREYLRYLRDSLSLTAQGA
jgi:hypothetical protein